MRRLESAFISGRDSNQRELYVGSGKILIEAAAVAEYLTIIGAAQLPASKYEVFEHALPTDVAKFHSMENESPE